MKKILLGFIGFAVVSIFILGGISYGDIPKILSYQGKLTDSGGTVITATKSMTFNLYSSVTGGSTLWTETQNVTVEAGIYSVLLGSVTALTLDFNTPYYLGVTVGSDSEMTPRKQLASAPSAFNADLLDGLNASSLVSSPASSVQGDILYHDGTSWSRLAAGTSGQFLKTQGSSADPVWAAAGGSGTVTSITAGTGLSGGTIAISGTIAIDNLGVDTAQIAAEAINESKLAGSNAPTDNYLLSYDLASTGFTWVDGSGATLVTNGGTQNLFAGENAGDSITTAQDLAFVGYNVGTAVTTGSYNTALGSTALLSTTTGASNTALGYNALAANTTGQNNIAVGVNALATNNAADNTAVGGDSLTLNTTGTRNTALGRDTLKANTTASDNTAMGYQTLDANTTGAENTAIGSGALGAVITGVKNTAVGANTLTNNTADDNTAVGMDSLVTNTIGTRNAALGKDSLKANTTGADNTAVGYNALLSNTTADGNTAVGVAALDENTTGTSNVAVGSSALGANISGSQNTAVGVFALLNNTTNNNTAVGNSALQANTSGSSNTAVGQSALVANTTGTSNTAVGRNSLAAVTTANSNTAVGDSALNVSSSGGSLTAVGANALAANTSGGSNTAVGMNCLNLSETGNENTGVGASTLGGLSSAGDNTAVGFGALGGNGNDNTAVGHSALANNSGNNNTGIGTDSLQTNGSGNNNTAIGYEAGHDNSTGTDNVFLGYQAGYSETGSNKLYIGNASATTLIYGEFDSGYTGIGRAQASYALDVYEDKATTYAARIYHNGNNTNRYGLLITCGEDTPTADNSTLITFQDGDGAAIGSVEFDNAQTYYNTSSDRRLKKDIVDTKKSINDLMKIKVRDFKFKKGNKELTGFIAQELYDIYPDAVSESNSPEKMWSVDYGKVTPLLVKAIQDQQKEIELLKEKIAKLEKAL